MLCGDSRIVAPLCHQIEISFPMLGSESSWDSMQWVFQESNTVCHNLLPHHIPSHSAGWQLPSYHLHFHLTIASSADNCDDEKLCSIKPSVASWQSPHYCNKCRETASAWLWLNHTRITHGILMTVDNLLRPCCYILLMIQHLLVNCPHICTSHL